MVGSYYYSCACNMTSCARSSTSTRLYITHIRYTAPVREEPLPDISRREAMEPTYRPGPAPVIPRYVDKYRAWRPTQQRARDGTAVRHKTGGLRKVS